MEKTTDIIADADSPSTKAEENVSPTAEVTIVKSGEKTYTKIKPAQGHTPNLSPPLKIDSLKAQENRTKRLKEDPRLKHLNIQSRIKAPLLRSSSMPVSVDDQVDAEKTSENEKSGMLMHRKIYRTGSISDYTKQKLKSTILMRTSASLVRKPSITDFEMKHIVGDADSSQSDEEDDDEEKDFKFSPTTQDVENQSEAYPSQSIASSCKAAQGPAAESLSSSLPEATVTLSVAITSG